MADSVGSHATTRPDQHSRDAEAEGRERGPPGGQPAAAAWPHPRAAPWPPMAGALEPEPCTPSSPTALSPDPHPVNACTVQLIWWAHTSRGRNPPHPALPPPQQGPHPPLSIHVPVFFDFFWGVGVCLRWLASVGGMGGRGVSCWVGFSRLVASSSLGCRPRFAQLPSGWCVWPGCVWAFAIPAV